MDNPEVQGLLDFRANQEQGVRLVPPEPREILALMATLVARVQWGHPDLRGNLEL